MGRGKEKRRVHAFAIGFPRSATRSVANIFSKLGYASEHEPEGADKPNVWLNLFKGNRKPLSLQNG
jgi:hypothetical protein